MPRGSILIVDDDGDRARGLAQALHENGFRSHIQSEVPDLEAALGPKSPWDCVVCTVNLEGVSWGSVRRAMRGFDVQVPVITIGEERDFESMSTALKLGATDFFVKPSEKPGLLLRSIERAVHHRQLQRELKRNRDRLEQANAELRHSLRILEQDQQAGRQVQRAMLPAGGLHVDGYWFSHKIFPSLYLSGDFTDYFQVGEHEVVFFLADVSGHGSSSAFATVLLKNLFARKRSDYNRRKDPAVTNPEKMLQFANRELLELAVNKYATMVVCVLNLSTHTLRYSVAGHLPQPILITDEGTQYLEGKGSPVGLLPEPVYEVHEVALPERFMLSVMSDGILEILPKVDLVEKEAFLLDRLKGPVCKPTEIARRLGLEGELLSDVPDDIAGLFLSRGLE